MCWPYPAWEMKLRPLPAEETEGVMYYDPAATGERIQNLRKDREVTQEQLAIDLNISDRYMRNLEKGEKVPSVDLFVELRERFGSSATGMAATSSLMVRTPLRHGKRATVGVTSRFAARSSTAFPKSMKLCCLLCRQAFPAN